MPVRATNTFDESLQKILADVARLKTMPDADLDFCVQLETEILQKIREPNDMLAQAQAQKAGLPPGGAPPPGAPPEMGGMPPEMAGAGAPGGGGGIPPELMAMLAGGGGPPGGATPGPGGLGLPPVAGTRVQPQMPNPDELRRMVQGQ